MERADHLNKTVFLQTIAQIQNFLSYALIILVQYLVKHVLEENLADMAIHSAVTCNAENYVELASRFQYVNLMNICAQLEIAFKHFLTALHKLYALSIWLNAQTTNAESHFPNALKLVAKMAFYAMTGLVHLL